ncbi:hypothetical protein ACE6H2_024270 [Prunus campanulata]
MEDMTDVSDHRLPIRFSGVDVPSIETGFSEDIDVLLDTSGISVSFVRADFPSQICPSSIPSPGFFKWVFQVYSYGGVPSNSVVISQVQSLPAGRGYWKQFP